MTEIDLVAERLVQLLEEEVPNEAGHWHIIVVGARQSYSEPTHTLHVWRSYTSK